VIRRVSGLRQDRAFSGLPQRQPFSPQEICSDYFGTDLLGRCCTPQNAEARLAEVVPKGAMNRDLIAWITQQFYLHNH